MNIDAALMELAQEQPPAELAGRRAAVLQSATFAPATAAGDSHALNLLLVGVALGMGIGGGLLLPTADAHASDYAVLTGVDHLSPSALLVGA